MMMMLFFCLYTSTNILFNTLKTYIIIIITLSTEVSERSNCQ